jgi:phage gpG-like protein
LRLREFNSMTFTLQLESADLLPDSLLEEIKAGCQLAMATAFKITAQNNLGEEGEDRPTVWRDLSNSPRGKKYQKMVGRSIATLYETGALHDSIAVDESMQPEACAVVCNSEYGYDHQFGDASRGLPSRPFFPMIGDELTPYTEAKCIEAAQDRLATILANQ